MTDSRLIAANGRVAAANLRGQVQAEEFVDGVQMSVLPPVVDLKSAPNGPRERQLLRGATVTVFEDRGGSAFIQGLDGYVGYVRTETLGAQITPTHMVGTSATHAYLEETFKSANLMGLPFGARVTVLDERRKFFETDVGFIPKSHLRPVDRHFSDPVTIAQMHFGVPYLWGGNSTYGIDCSGLVAAGLSACGIACPADSDQQCDALGADIGGDLQRGDLIFWHGHVGLMVDEATIIHANAHHMATAYEPIKNAILRIKAQGDGDVTARKRL